MKRSIATVSISGTLEDKFNAAAQAGFDGIEIFENDLTQSAMSPVQVRQLAESLNLEIIALQPFRDFEAMPDALRSKNFYRAQKKFELMHELGTKNLMVCSNVSPFTINDPARAAHDLYELAELANKEGFHISYEALAWGIHTKDYNQAWEIVKQADHDQLGIVLDTFHMFVRGNTLDLLRDEIPLDKISLVQVADAPRLQMDSLYFSRHFRCFPGQGDLPVVDFARCLREKGFQGYLSHEIFNDEFRASSPYEKAVDGMRSLLWLEEQSELPLCDEKTEVPSVENIEFVEVASGGEAGEQFVNLFQALGFQETHRHKSKDITLMRQGDINIVLNREPESQAHQHFEKHGASICALGFAVNRISELLSKLDYYRCSQFQNQTGPGELNIPAIRGVGDSLIYFVENQDNYKFYDIDFAKLAQPDADQPSQRNLGLKAIDHLGQTVAPADYLHTSFHYRSLFDFDITPTQDLPDVYGLVVSRVASNSTHKVRIPINMSMASDASSQRFLKHTNGAGVQQIAFACDDIFAAADQVDKSYVLEIPDNYYRDLEARCQLDEAFLARLKQFNLLYDENADGQFLHFYTREINGVFFEVLQRIGDYGNYGEINAHIRLASQARETAKQR
ncbi:bifunctional sugar phosphate isomerase/epimerase/4-hydroxyphenylpyruvate dioxygenase family protein [Vibrio mangrovi]|uniref:3-dehydroshikimate dehydratase n=1 Tax=Vibrio mangrovi TaxID=474394 RepID=A0A1Y6IZW9_9VIBR|nr:sugar phosphate isomerase/epimerase and 4-hydroxyphenylpyruvate domain-containing protein [Vibrio mangrovi]MDW6005238.1 TIM barrel protein [Vibrio mangrovi]SMS02551.1 4-hydroxyphenylpyruvate dioxygenase [Vibrio mangrovi]